MTEILKDIMSDFVDLFLEVINIQFFGFNLLGWLIGLSLALGLFLMVVKRWIL